MGQGVSIAEEIEREKKKVKEGWDRIQELEQSLQKPPGKSLFKAAKNSTKTTKK